MRIAKAYFAKKRPQHKIDRPPKNLRYPVGEWYEDMKARTLDDVLTGKKREIARKRVAR